MHHAKRGLTDVNERVSHLINWGRVSGRRNVRHPALRRPLISTFVWVLITGALANLTIVGSLVDGAQVGVPALLWFLTSVACLIHSPYRWRKWREACATPEPEAR